MTVQTSQHVVRLLPHTYVSPSPGHTKYRPDIDGLRAIAILSVVGFHAFPGAVRGGFVGVDIFFVISGFLISTIVLQDLARETFSFAEFYARRIRRIFPALLVVLLATFAFGWFSLFADEYKQLGKHIAGGAGFISNLLLWNESGYFDNSAETKPLLHLWSLGIEEQFYIAWPLLLWASRKWRLRLLWITLALAGVSFILNVLQIRVDPAGAFYSPQTRFWELLIGSILAYLMRNESDLLAALANSFGHRKGAIIFLQTHDAALKNLISFLGGALIVSGILLINKELAFPGYWALLPTVGAALAISAGAQSWLNRIVLSSRFAIFVGLISFPLYLWHWPLLSFARILKGGTPTLWIRAAAIFIAVALAWLTHWLVEKPIRFGANRRRKTVALIALVTTIGLLGFFSYQIDGFEARKVNLNSAASQYGSWYSSHNGTCQNKYRDQLTFCMASSEHPEIILFGDSHANQFYPGLEEAYGKKKGLLSIGNGPPLDGIRIKFSNFTSHAWQQGYISYPKVMNIIATNADIKTVVLGANWETLIHGNFVPEEMRASFGGVKLIDLNDPANGISQEELFSKAFERTLARLTGMHKNIVIAIDTPELFTDVGGCVQRSRSESTEEMCTFSKEAVLRRQAFFRKQLAGLKNTYPNIRIFDPVPILCPGNACPVIRDGKLFYRDDSHITEISSRLLGPELRKIIDSFD